MTVDEAKKLKPGTRLRYTAEGPDYGDQGTVEEVFTTGVNVRWDDGNEIGYSFHIHGGYHFRNLEGGAMIYTADVYFQDEAPRIRCGWRRCRLNVGPKWVRFEEIASGRAARLPRHPLDGTTMRRYDLLERMKPRRVG